MDEPPTCFVKTQFGSLQGHIAIVYLLDALKRQYISNLYVNDESEFYEHRDPVILSQKLKQLGDAIRSLGNSLQEYGLSDEAAEDPEILASRIERVARLVAERMKGSTADFTDDPADHDEEDVWDAPTLEEEVETMDRVHRRSQQRSERMTRRIDEATAAGMSTEDAFELALREEGLEPPSANGQRQDSEEYADEDEGASDVAWESISESEAWRASLDVQSDDWPGGFEKNAQHPAVVRAEKLLFELMKLDVSRSRSDSFANTATRGLIDVVGGLVQATSGDLDDRSGRARRALAIVQLKRALKGHAFCRGAVFGLRGTPQFDQATCDHFHDELEAILQSIHGLLSAAWDESAP